MAHLDRLIGIFREVLAEKTPLPFGELAAAVEGRAGNRGLEVSRFLIARLVVAALENLDPARIAFSNIPPFLVL